MALKSIAEELIVIHPLEDQEESHIHNGNIHLEPLEVMAPDLEVSEDEPAEHHHTHELIEVRLELDFVPGAPEAEDIVVKEAPIEAEEEEEKKEESDSNDAKKVKKSKWDWAAHGATGFVAWIKERFDSVPRHSGKDVAGLSRAVSYLEKLDKEISNAMRLDLDGELDADKVEEVRVKIEEGIERLDERINTIKKGKKRTKKSANYGATSLVKEGQKITGVHGIVVTVPLLISRIARVCINGVVSAGHDLEDLFARQAKKYKLTDREKAEVMQLLTDMGYPLRQDRGFLLDEDVDTSSSDNFDYAANYTA